MAKFNEYPSKATPEDADTLMVMMQLQNQTNFHHSAESGTGLSEN